jgi:hypothetical protein
MASKQQTASKTKRQPAPQRQPAPKTTGRLQIFFWNLPGSAALEATVKAAANRLPFVWGACQLWLSLVGAETAASGRRAPGGGAGDQFQTEVHLSAFADGPLAGWKIVVQNRHADPVKGIRSAFISAARALASGPMKMQRRPPSPVASVQIRPQLETARA